MGEPGTVSRATVVDPRPPSVARSVSRTIDSVATPIEALHAVEARRAWVLMAGMSVLCAASVAMVIALGGDPLGQWLHGAALAVTAVAGGSYAVFRRDPRRYRPWQLLAVGYVTMLVTGTGLLYWGVFSVFVAVIPVGCYMFASENGPRAAAAGSGATLLMHGGLGIAQIAGWMTPHSLVVGSTAFGPRSQLIALVVTQIIIVASTLAGVDNRRTTLRVLADYHAAVRELVVRDALLAEAHQRAAEARGPGEGRYSGQLLGRFRLGAVIGRGAMGEVYAAEDGDGGGCAVKVLAAHVAHDAETLKRFDREARAIGALHAPNIVRMLEVSPPDAPVPFLAMERLDGTDLGELIQAQPRRELAEVVAIITAAAAGLDAAHAAGVIHRDLKPANIFAARGSADERVTWKLLDFGVSKLTGPDATATVGQLIGTPGYMAPEQATGAAVDRRADIYALGVVAYRLLTGTPAVVPGDLPAMIHEVVYRTPPQPSERAVLPPGIAPAVDAVLAVALAKRPDDRFASAGELAAMLAAAAACALPPAVAARAAEIVQRAPWGAWDRKPVRRGGGP